MSNQLNDEILARLYDEAWEELQLTTLWRSMNCTTLQSICKATLGV